MLAERLVEEALQAGPENRRRDHRDDEQPGEPALRVVADSPVPDRREPRPEDLDQVSPEVDEQRDEGAHVEHHVERGRFDERVVPAQQARDEDQVRRRGNRQELGQALDDPQDRGVNQRFHVWLLTTVGSAARGTTASG